VSHIRDRKLEHQSASLLNSLRQSSDPIERAKLARDLRDVAETLITSNVRGANATGVTWRQISAELGVPFQTLYRRYAVSR
jgi:hypothetical protein